MHEMESDLRLRKGAWTTEEDDRLRSCIAKYGEVQWHRIPIRAGLNRCRKSCRLRWMNYLNPNIKRGDFEEDEIDLIIRMYNLLGNRWTLIAGRLPGRTGNTIKNYWNTHLKQKISSVEIPTPQITRNNISRPQARTVSKNYFYLSNNQTGVQIGETSSDQHKNSEKLILPKFADNSECILWWETLLGDANDNRDEPEPDHEMKESNNTAAMEKNTEINAGNNIVNETSNVHDKSMWDDFCLDDVSFEDLLHGAQDLSM